MAAEESLANCTNVFCYCVLTCDFVSVQCHETKKEHAEADKQAEPRKKQLKCNWKQAKETESSTGFTTITTTGCNSYRSFLAITPTSILLLTTSGCSQIQRCSVFFRETCALICMQPQRHVNIHKCRQTFTLCSQTSKNTEYIKNLIIQGYFLYVYEQATLIV